MKLAGIEIDFIDKQHVDPSFQKGSQLKRVLYEIRDNYDYFKKFDEIVIYYDEGQDYLTKILHSAFSTTLSNYRLKKNVNQENYRILQCADMVCSLELIKQRQKK